jgi:hypothetical protein
VPELDIILQNGIKTSAKQTTLDLQELIVNMKASGMSTEEIKKILLRDLENSGPIFGQFKNSVKATVTASIGMAGNGAVIQTMQKKGVEKFKWVTTGKNTCPDCDARHGEIGTMEYFETIGLPQSGFSVCGPNCNCTFVSAGYTGENLDQPLLRGK